MTGLVVAGALYVDLGDGRESPRGDRAGQIRWRCLPRARYECLRCRTTETPNGNGPGDVARFVAAIRTSHICRIRQPQAA
ncbi:hypothetical protein [Streptomyces sp. NPDC001635]